MRDWSAYRHSLERELASWGRGGVRADDPWSVAIGRIPPYFEGLVQVAGFPELNDHQRRVVHRVIKYLVSPLDLMPQLIYGPLGFREDITLVALLVRELEQALGREVVARAGLSSDGEGLRLAIERSETDLDPDVLAHLRLLLATDSVAGDEPLAETGPPQVDEVTVAPAGQHTMVFAGPGTGKTFRLETELQRLLLDEGVPPEQILVSTFTNKAADELRLRIRRRLEAEGSGPAVDEVMQKLTISTIHAFCFELIVRFHHHALFLKGAHSPMDETRRMLFLFRHGIGSLRLKPIYPEWRQRQREMPGWRPSDLFHFYRYVGEVYDFLSEDVLKDAQLGLRGGYLELAQGLREPETVDERIIATYPRYWRLIQQEGYLDQSMVLSFTEALLDDPQVRYRVQSTWRHLLVDEYQDTNPIQDRIFRAIAGGGSRLFAVADDDQSIYAFRGADVRNATRFTERWPEARMEKLEENRRSTGRILAAARSLIEHNGTREFKDLHTRNREGVPPWRVEAEEKALPGVLANRLLQLQQAGCIERWDEVVILFRGLTKRVAEYRTALDDYGIPNVISGDRRFLKRPVVRGLLKIFDMIRGEAAKLTTRKRAHRPFFEALGWTDRRAMVDQVASWHRAVRDGEYESLLELFYTILDDTDALALDELLPDLGHFSNFLAQSEAQLTSPDLIKRLSYFVRYADAATASFAAPEPEPEAAVRLMTIHKSKGLETPVVVVADAIEGMLPMIFPEDVRTRLKRELAGLDPQLDPDEEERRVLYVAMTRAQRYLLLATVPEKPSPYLREFDVEPFPEAPTVMTGTKGKGAVSDPVHLGHGEVYNYHFCPRRYLLESCYGFAGQPIAPIRAGQTLHRSLEIYHRLKRDGERVTADRTERIFERAWIRPRGKREARREQRELFPLFERYTRRWEAEEGRMRVLETEKPIFIAQGGGVLAGRIDLVREYEGRPEIVELKYHENPMLPDYPRRQLEHYSLAFPREKPRLVVHYLSEDREEVVSGRGVETIRGELDAVFAGVRRGEFRAKPEPRKCRLCPVRFACVERA